MPKRRKGKPAPLDEYRAKRSAGRTPEPFRSEVVGRPGLFVVQKHAARNLHFDLRLEMGGVLKSWAVPKGPSLDPQVKRLAMMTEDHPVEYADFEGIIPEGNYGAGAVIVWDHGVWIPLEDPGEGFQKGKLLFELRGYKLGGVWTLFKIKRGEKEWLLVKKPDAHADPEGELVQGSIFSGRTVEELRDGVDPAVKIRNAMRRLGARRKKIPEKLEVMQAQTREEAFSDPGWVFELKYDGFRMLATRDAKRARLRYRRGREATGTFPEIEKAVRALPFDGLTMDGEIVVLDENGRPSFQRLQQRFQLTRRADIRQAAVRLPCTYFAFDLLGLEGHDLRSLPLLERKKILRRVIPAAGPLRYSDHVEERGREMFDEVMKMGLEGIVAKRADSPYRPGRSADWQKIRVDRTGDFVIVGYSAPKGSRTGFGALHLALYEGEGLVYAGRVGTGFSDQQLSELLEALEASRRADPPFTGAPPKERGHVWVEPRLVSEVRYKEWTRDGLLRHPVFLRIRDDKAVEECVSLEPVGLPEEPLPPPASPPDRKVNFTNLDKVFWPGEGHTKGDLIEYYRAVSPWLLPYLRDRPVVLTRYPDGVDGKSFFQKDAPGYVPGWVRTEKMWSEHARREIHYFVCDDEESLLYVVNMGTIPLHVWSSRVASLQAPDWCILDLDPKEAPFGKVVKVARGILSLCREIELDCFVKTSGSTGLHVLIPLGGQCTYEQSRSLGELMAGVVASRLPEIATITRSLAGRRGRVYIDYVQNGHGRLLVSPFSVRPLPGAPVSMPLRWAEVNSKLEIGRFTIETAPRRLQRAKGDPLRPVLRIRPDLTGALERLHQKLEDEG